METFPGNHEILTSTIQAALLADGTNLTYAWWITIFILKQHTRSTKIITTFPTPYALSHYSYCLQGALMDQVDVTEVPL